MANAQIVVNLPWKALPREDAITPRWCVKPAVLDHVMEAVRMEATMTKYPVVKMKELRNYKIGDVVRLKKNGKLVEIAKYASYTGSCKRCVFGDQCRYYKTGCVGIGGDFGGNSVYFKPVEE